MLSRLLQRIHKVPALSLLAGSVAAAIAIGFIVRTPKPVAPLPAPQPVVVAVAAQPVVSVATPAPPRTDKATTVLELFNPSDQALTHQLNETNIVQQIEQIMATSYVLTNCKLISQNEYRDSFRALIVYAEQIKFAANAAEAEAKVRASAQSASVSYSLIYRRTRCNDPELPGIARQLLAWQKAYLRE